MALSRSAMAVTVVAAVLCVWIGAGEAATDCTSTLASLTGCSTYLTNPSSTPDEKGCCEPLQTVLSSPSSFQCICAQASNSDNPLFKNALGLPKACKLDINVSEANCTSASTTPSTTPTSSNSSTTPTTPKVTGSPSAGFISASPYSPLIAAALLYSIALLFLQSRI